MFEYLVMGARAYVSAWLVLVVAAICMQRYGKQHISEATTVFFTSWATYFTLVCMFNGLFSYMFNVTLFNALWLDLIVSACVAFWRGDSGLINISFKIGSTETKVTK